MEGSGEDGLLIFFNLWLSELVRRTATSASCLSLSTGFPEISSDLLGKPSDLLAKSSDTRRGRPAATGLSDFCCRPPDELKLRLIVLVNLDAVRTIENVSFFTASAETCCSSSEL